MNNLNEKEMALLAEINQFRNSVDRELSESLRQRMDIYLERRTEIRKAKHLNRKPSLSELNELDIAIEAVHIQETLLKTREEDAWFFRTQDELSAYDGMDVGDIPLKEVSEDLRQLILENRTSDN